MQQDSYSAEDTCSQWSITDQEDSADSLSRRTPDELLAMRIVLDAKMQRLNDHVDKVFAGMLCPSSLHKAVERFGWHAVAAPE